MAELRPHDISIQLQQILNQYIFLINAYLVIISAYAINKFHQQEDKKEKIYIQDLFLFGMYTKPI